MKKILSTIFVLSILSFGLNVCAFANGHEGAGVSAEDALQKLKTGNQHFAMFHLAHPNVTKERLDELTVGQHPFAAVLSCSDSRVPPEIIFDQGLGDLFVIRDAGNVPGAQVIGSVEYAIEHAGVKLVVVLGHESCGAVKASCACDAHQSKYIESLTSFIKPSVEKAKKQQGDLYENASKNNAKAAAKTLVGSSPVVAEYVKEHGVKIVPAYYNLHTGAVEFLGNE